MLCLLFGLSLEVLIMMIAVLLCVTVLKAAVALTVGGLSLCYTAIWLS